MLITWYTLVPTSSIQPGRSLITRRTSGDTGLGLGAPVLGAILGRHAPPQTAGNPGMCPERQSEPAPLIFFSNVVSKTVCVDANKVVLVTYTTSSSINRNTALLRRGPVEEKFLAWFPIPISLAAKRRIAPILTAATVGTGMTAACQRGGAYAGLPHTNSMCEHTRSQVYAWSHEFAIKLLISSFVRYVRSTTKVYDIPRHHVRLMYDYSIRCAILYVFYHTKS